MHIEHIVYLSGIWNMLCLPSIPLDRSNFSIHCILLPQQVPDTALRNTEYVHEYVHVVHIMHILHIYETTYIYRHILHIFHI